MKIAETRMKTVLKDTIMALCRNMLGQSGHVQVEGLLGITLNHEEIFLVNISQSISKLMEVKQEIATEEMNSDEQGDDSESPQTARTARSRLDDSPVSPKRQRKRGRRKKMAEESSRGDDDLDELQNVLSINNELQNESAESGSNDDSRDDTRLNISDSQAMLDVYGNIINSQADEASERLQTFSAPCDNDNESKDQVVVKTEVNSDEEQDSSCALDSTTHNAPWPAALSSIFAPSMKMPALHLPNITNMVMGDGNSSCAEGSSVNPEWFGSPTKSEAFPGRQNATEQCRDGRRIAGIAPGGAAVALSNRRTTTRGLRKWTRRQRGPEAIVELMLAEKNAADSRTCPLCGRKFGEAWIMRRHMMVHTGAKAYQCFICQKKFTRKDVLSAHMKTHYSLKKDPAETFDKTPTFPTSLGLSDDNSEFTAINSSVSFPWNGAAANPQHLSSPIFPDAVVSPSFKQCSNKVTESSLDYGNSNHTVSPPVGQTLVQVGEIDGPRLG